MAYRWGPNRDSGCVRRHRNPNTRRRYNDPMGKAWNVLSKTYRVYEHRVMAAAMPYLVTGEYDVNITPLVRTGWDEGDPFMPGTPGEIVCYVGDHDPRLEIEFRAQPYDWSAWLKANADDPRFL